jgi:nucleotidyltransferase substrate binding protein (TIGR01987 family)
MIEQNIPLQQRLQQFERALSLLEQALEKPGLSAIERAGMVQFYEVSCEMSWNLLKEYAEAKGHAVTSPKSAVERAIGLAIVRDAEGWLSLLQNQWMTSEIYDEATAIVVEENIRMKYFPLLAQLHHEFSIMIKEKEA